MLTTRPWLLIAFIVLWSAVLIHYRFNDLVVGGKICNGLIRKSFNTANQNKMIKYASANALRTITNEITIFHTHTQIHTMTNRAMPDQMIKYKHSLMLHKLMRQCTPY